MVDIEGDSELVRTRLLQKATRCAAGEAIVAEILAFLTAHPRVQTQVVRRSTNGAAHSV
ncbi:hypothetical protein LINGRAHAP2_LOCUS29755, partial [Linum grandiflorum]